MVFKEQLCHFQSHLLPNFSMWAWDIELEWGSCLYTLNRFNETKRWCANCAHSTATATTEQSTKKKTANLNKKRQTANNKMKFHLFCTYHAKLIQLILLYVCYDMSPLKIPFNTQKSEAETLLKFQNSREHYVDYLGLRSNNKTSYNKQSKMCRTKDNSIQRDQKLATSTFTGSPMAHLIAFLLFILRYDKDVAPSLLFDPLIQWFTRIYAHAKNESRMWTRQIWGESPENSGTW